MELNELKKMWETEDQPLRYERAELTRIFEMRTKRAVARITKNMLLDAILMLVTTAGFVAVTFILGLKSRFVISGELMTIALILGIHFQIKYRTLHRLDFTTTGIQEAIQLVVRKLKNYIMFYKISIPLLSGGLFVWYRLNVHYYKYGTYTLDHPWREGVITGVITIAVFFLTLWLTRLMYGAELKKLQQLQKDLAHEF